MILLLYCCGSVDQSKNCTVEGEKIVSQINHKDKDKELTEKAKKRTKNMENKDKTKIRPVL